MAAIVKVFYIDWENGGSRFLRTNERITVTSSAQKIIRIHVFHNHRSNPETFLPKEWEWISKHPNSTEDVTSVALESTLITDRKLLSSPSVTLYLVSSDEARFVGLISVIKTNTRVVATPINSKSTSITDCCDYVCSYCLMIFRDSSEKDQHDRLVHLLCSNPTCERGKKGNGFKNAAELHDHVARQRKCDICESGRRAGLIFCSVKKRDEHIKSVHVRRVNAIRNPSALDNEEQTVIHFRYSLYPLPCYAEPACAQRFRTTVEQVIHHVTYHECEFPYVCMACVDRYVAPVCLRSKRELLEHAKLMEHQDKEFILTD